MTSPCSTSCGPGIEEYERSCSAPEQRNIGLDCDRSGLLETKEEPCNIRKCIGNGKLIYFGFMGLTSALSFSGSSKFHHENHGKYIIVSILSSVALHFSAFWGDWGSMEICPGPHDYVTGLAIKSESGQGSKERKTLDITFLQQKYSYIIPGGDDTAMNGIRVYCKDGSSHASRVGGWGGWNGPNGQCADGVNGASVRIEGNQVCRVKVGLYSTVLIIHL